MRIQETSIKVDEWVNVLGGVNVKCEKRWRQKWCDVWMLKAQELEEKDVYS